MNSVKEIKEPVLVTGATGFIGSRVVSQLIEQGTAVRALVLPEEAVPEEWAEQVEVVRGSITDDGAVGKAVQGVATVIHLAAVVSDWGDEKQYWQLTVEGTRRIYDRALENGSLVVLVSSIIVYGDNIHRQVCSEEAGFGRTFGPYGRTKQAQEKLAWEYHEKRGMRLTVVRPANVYGPRSGPWLHDVVEVLRSGSPALVSGGKMNAGLAYVDNVADLILLAGALPADEGRVYNACDGLEVTWEQYFTDLAALIGAKKPGSLPRPLVVVAAGLLEKIWKLLAIQKRPPVTREALNLVGSDNRIPVDRAVRELGFRPRVLYKEGLRHVRDYLEAQNFLQSRK